MKKGEQQAMVVDNLYQDSIIKFYLNTEKSINEIWPGMKFAPVCLFRVNGPALLYNHPNPPQNFKLLKDKLYIGQQKDLLLFGATQIEINGTLTAIVDYGQSRYSCIEEVYAELFHELHHVYQRSFVKHCEFDNPAILLSYPENYINDGLKLHEQKLIFNLCFVKDKNKFQKLLNQIYTSRIKRQEIIGEYLNYEKTVESVEGPAFYSEYLFYNKFAHLNEKLKDNYNQKHFFGILTTPFYGRKNLRQRHLASGMAMCFILKKHFENWQKEYYSKKISLYDYFISKFKPQKEELEIDNAFQSLSKFYTQQEIQKHKDSWQKFNKNTGIKITLKFACIPQFKGFDPMNAEAVNEDIILHRTMLKLSGSNGNSLSIINNEVATIIENEIWFVKKVILYVSKESIQIENNRIVVNEEEINIFWQGELNNKNKSEIVFICE